MFSFFERLTNPFPAEPPTQPPTTMVAFCKHYTKGMWAVLLTVSLLSAIVAILEVTLFGFMGKLVDWFAERDRATFVEQESNTLILMGIVVVVLIPGFILLRSLFSRQSLLGNYPMRIRWQAHRYLLGQSLSFFHNEFAGRVATKVMQTALSVRETVMKLLDLMVYIGVYFISMVVLIFTADWRLALPLVVWLGVYIGILRVLVPKLKQVSQYQADARSLMTGRIVDSYTNISTVKLFSHSQREASYAQESMDKFLHTVYPQMRLVTILEFCVELSNALLIFSVGALSVYLWLQQIVTPGEIALAVSLCLRLNGMSHWVMWEVASLFENLGTVQDGINTLAQPIAVKNVDKAPALNVSGGQIHFKNMSFSYPGANDKPVPVFKNLDLDIKPGEKVGLVGRSGAGKSTLVNLLLRFYDTTDGQILIDGQDISQVDQESLRAQISMVTQDTSLMHRSVRDNIIYGRNDADDAAMIEAAEQAEAFEFIQQLSDKDGRTGFDAQVGERGVKLSGGQRQRIAIARVLLKDAPVLILDEATSALDSEVESAIQECLNKVMENKTVLAIAHRLSTIAQMDRLLVLDNGEIVEQGTHQELLEKGGIYAKLWAHQTGGFLGLE
ncbi:multidrug ABC transporter ATP-binding protein [Alteromonas alba]|jgi:ATP-binding cassette subfamily B multidrug efflux pump|uniref:Multidrug ABC transporter ATP-binding protein n=1 Tax=Alteromonas alba TaxID=2079529 RepID=A0A2S9V8F5_9ALTE|nr:ABC transporter ATP-binding protein [Alteromonas alba]HCA75591.1 ABC transporter ATP-binding protein [Alteromonas sp.]PRO72714.1 multidrug ABC transporter ATP-binding protein [Alteromonas alba]HCB08028.1 ABC transporter ATP-binding protein [Alteromonas sp.]HCL10603.1 ABC transporter ATP-binding protein [Alteromonas sp.]HCV19584.1 ABC transporter ATP-binding protein [Alteromonas sp.]|tara:strand:+ start:501 stop:2342 length:1842 start_codon:yes stop_codon:yes gene_type:complete